MLCLQALHKGKVEKEAKFRPETAEYQPRDECHPFRDCL